MDATKTYTYNTLAKALHININKQLVSIIYDSYTEIIVTTYMNHLHRITHKHIGNYNHIYDNL
jgi:hypothetical protein